MGRPATPIHIRFWQKVDCPGNGKECWPWLGAKDRDGYGFIKRKDGAQLRAHRVSYEMYVGYIPKGFFICHTCDNPSCVNPNHLFLGTPKDNVKDMINKGRKAKTFGSYNAMSKLTETQVIAIRNDKRKSKDIAKDYSLNEYHINSIRSRRCWKHLQ